jgi:iron(III) transport system substrate-binding protein
MLHVKGMVAAAALSVAFIAQAQVPAGYPASYGDVVAAANKEGKVVVYSTTDTKAAQPILKDFQALYPNVKVEYNDMNSTEAYSRFIAEAASGQGSADVLWSSAMDLQLKLVDDGLAQAYASPEAGKLPAWANYKGTAYGTTFEPAAMIYNKRLVPPEDVPTDHASFARVINAKPDKYKGKVTTYDIEKSGVGYMFVVQDQKNFKDFDQLVKGFGATGYKVYGSTGNMVEKVSSGEHLLGYNILGSYALVRAKKDPNLGVVLPKDYTLVLSRVVFISKQAKNPNAAKLWVDYLLSPRGQKVIADQAELFSVRADVQGEHTAASLTKELGDSLKPIPLTGDIVSELNEKKRLEFLGRWKSLLGTK